MVLFLRTQNNKTIVDCEIFSDGFHTELKCSIDIEEYSNLLLHQVHKGKSYELIEEFSAIQELRGWMYEVRGNNTAGEYMNIVADVREQFLKPLAEKYDLRYIED